MARNHKFYFDRDGTPRARGPAAERVFMSFLEADVQGSDHVCRVLMEDLEAIEDGTDESREFTGNAHALTLTRDGVVITGLPTRGEPTADDADGAAETYTAVLKHYREVLEDWEAFILDDLPEDAVDDDLPA